MFYATKGFIRLEVKFNGGITIVPMVATGKFTKTARIIAQSHIAILNFELRDIPTNEKEDAMKQYFRRNTWEIESPL